MFDRMVERVAVALLLITTNPQMKVQRERDWDGFLGFISGLMKILAPLMALCPAGGMAVKERSAAWLAALEGGRRGMRKLDWGERAIFGLWRFKFRRAMGRENRENVSPREMQRACLMVAAESDPEEILEMQGVVAELVEEAA